jgi:hypothetical protein
MKNLLIIMSCLLVAKLALAENCSNEELMAHAQANSILSASSESINESLSGYMSSSNGKNVFFIADLVSMSGKREIARIECNKETGEKVMSTSTRPGRVVQESGSDPMTGLTNVLGAMQRPDRN